MRTSISYKIITAVFCAITSILEAQISVTQATFPIAKNSFYYSSEDICKIAAFDPEFKNNRLFLCGELHYFENNWAIKVAFVQFFNKKYSVNRVFIEYPCSYDHLYNSYLLYGDSSVFTYLPYITPDTLNEKRFLLELRKYNLSLPDSNKVSVVGIDIEKNAIVSLRELYKLYPIQINPAILKSYLLISKWRSKERISERKTKHIVRRLYEDFYSKQSEFRIALQGNFMRYKRIIDGLYLGFMSQFNVDDQALVVRREKFMIDGILDELSSSKQDKYFGQLGLAHCGLNLNDTTFTNYPYTSLASWFNSDSLSPIRNQVCSFVQYYTQMNDTTYLIAYLGKHRSQLLSNSAETVTLFYLGEESSSLHGQFLIVNRNALGPYVK